MNTAKISDLPNGTTINPAKDLIEVSQYNPSTGGYVSIKSPAGLSGGLATVKFTMNANITTDQILTITGGNKFIPVDCIATNASINLTVAANFQGWTGPNKTGIQFLNSAAGLVNLTSSTKAINFLNTNQITIIASDVIGATAYLSISVPQGVAATFDVYLKYYIVG